MQVFKSVCVQVFKSMCETYQLLEDLLRLVILHAELKVHHPCMGHQLTLNHVSVHNLKKLKFHLHLPPHRLLLAAAINCGLVSRFMWHVCLRLVRRLNNLRCFFLLLLLKYECVLETKGSVCLHFKAVMCQGVD